MTPPISITNVKKASIFEIIEEAKPVRIQRKKRMNTKCDKAWLYAKTYFDNKIDYLTITTKKIRPLIMPTALITAGGYFFLSALESFEPSSLTLSLMCFGAVPIIHILNHDLNK